MKIIKAGEYTEKQYRVTCYRCGCQFEAAESEVTPVINLMLTAPKRVKCPTCKLVLAFNPATAEIKEG